MSLPTVNDVQAIDPVLTNMLVGYMQGDNRFVADKVFPNVPVDKDSGTYYIFTKKYWFLDEMPVRVPGGQYARGDYGLETSTYTTVQRALAKPIADEERANSQVPMDLETAAVRWLNQRTMIRRERAFASAAFATSVWDNTDNNSATDWDDYSSGDPVANILAAGRTVSNGIGVSPNTLVVGSIVNEALLNHPDILDRVKYTTAAVYGNVANALAAVLDIERYLVSKASYSNTNETAAFSASAIVDDDALLLYTTPTPGLFEPTAGYTYSWAPGGGLGMILRNRDELNDTDVIKTKNQWVQKIVSADAGYLWLDIV